MNWSNYLVGLLFDYVLAAVLSIIGGHAFGRPNVLRRRYGVHSWLTTNRHPHVVAVGVSVATLSIMRALRGVSSH